MARRLSGLLPRDSERWVFGSRGDLYTDNSMYLFEFVRRNSPEIQAVWISGDRELVRRLRDNGRAAYHRASVSGILYLLRAKVNVYSSDPSDTSFAFTGGAINVNLYHGLPIKQIEFDIESAAGRRVYHPATLLGRIRSRTVYAAKWTYQDVLATSSEWAEEQFRRSYQGRVGHVVRACAPRMSAALSREPLPAKLFPVEHELVSTVREQGGKTLLYAPTWRRYEWDVSESLGDLGELEMVLEETETTLFVKTHLFCKGSVEGERRVVGVPDSVDVSAILPHVDGLITDYSSIGLDAALLGKPVIWTPIDRAKFQELESPNFDLDYDALTRGHAVASSSELLSVLADGEWSDWTVPAALIEQIWGRDAQELLASGNSRLVEAVRAVG